MRKLDKHVSISQDLDVKVKTSSKKHKRTYSDELNFIIFEYFNGQDELTKILISLESDIKFILKKVNILFELVKQVYADMNFTNIKEPKTSYPVNEFLKKMKKDKYDD